MKKKIQSVIITALACTFIFSTSALAGSVTKTINLKIDTWNTSEEVKESELDFALARCIAVYPYSGEDKFHKIKARIKWKGDIVTEKNAYVLTEGEYRTYMEYATVPPVGETVKMQFHGNDDSKEAIAEVYYIVN